MKRGGNGGEGPSVEVGAGPNSKLCRCVLVKKEQKKRSCWFLYIAGRRHCIGAFFKSTKKHERLSSASCQLSHLNKL